jgi:hypothetical protein
MITKHEVLKANLKKWLECRGNREKRGILIRELSKILSIHPKSVGRSMRRLQLKDKSAKEKRGREVYYGKDVNSAIEKIWKEMEYPCGENMHPAIGNYITYFIIDKDWNFGDITTGKLRAINLGTLKLRIKAMRKKKGLGHGKSATVSSPLKGMIPIRKSHTWTNLPPGYVQVDSVVHCGDILTGDVIYSVGAVDFATYWSEYVTQWNKGRFITCESLKTIRKRFPFDLCEIHLRYRQ